VAENMVTNGDTARDSAMKAARNKVRRLAEKVERSSRSTGRLSARASRSWSGMSHTCSPTYEVRRGSAARTGARDYWEDVERGIGG
jgi:hypothetical protein